jgi:serine/threonine protein kinase
VKLAKVKQEAKILSSFNHPHIMRVYEFIESNEGIFIVMEYLEGGELYEFILGKQRFSEDEARKYFQQLIHALGYCHSHGVVHRDVKPENILLDDQNNIKLGDFGLSTYFNDGIFLKTSCGSLNYAAPEIIAGEIYSGPEVDIWSAGVVLFLLVSGYLPFDENNMYGLFQKIKSAEYLFPHNLSEACKDLISRMLDTDPVTRISISQINHHPWYTINIQNHLTYDTNCMLKKDQTMCLIECKARSSHILDEEIFKKCLQFNLTPENYTEERLRRRLVKQKQDEFCVAYRIMQDTNEKKKRDELNNMSLDIVPTFTNTRNSIDRPSCELRRSLSVIEDFDTLALLFPHNWMIGFRTTLELAECMKIFLKSCKSNNLVKFKQVMKKLNTFHYQFKNEKIRFVCKIFKVMGMKIECAYVVDFRRAFGPSMHFLSVCADVYRAMHLINKRIHRF